MQPIKAPYLPYDKLRGIADDFLNEHHASGELPVPIEEIVEFRLSIDIVPVPGLQKLIDVDAFISSDLSEIRVDRFVYENRPARYRFSLAHEVAHWLIHRDVFALLKFSTVQGWMDALASIPEDQYGWIENQAYNLAGLILVPSQPLRDLFENASASANAAGVDLQSRANAQRSRCWHTGYGKWPINASRFFQ